MAGRARRALADHGQNGFEAVLDVKVAFALRTVAQDLQPVGVLAQLAIEVEDVPVSVTLAQDGNEAEDVAFEAEAFAKGRNQSLAGDFGGAIERGLDGKGRRFRGGNCRRFAVDRAGGGEGQPANAIGPHGLENVEGRQGVLLDVAAGIVRPEAHVGVGREVEDKIAASHRPGQGRAV